MTQAQVPPSAPVPRLSPASTPTSPRPSAGFTWLGFLSIWAGLIGGVMVFCGGTVVNAVVVQTGEGDLDPGVLSEQGQVLTTVLAVLAAMAILAGFVGAVAAARRHNRLRGEYGGRPRATLRIFLSPRGLSRLLFTPSGVYRIDDTLIARLGAARSAAGVLVFGSVIAYYEPAAVVDYAEQTFIQAGNAIVVAAIVLVGSLAVAFARVEPTQRRLAARALSRPLLPLVAAGAVVGILAAFSWINTEPAQTAGDRREDVLVLLFNPLALWPIVFIFCATYYLARNLFNSGDAHPLLAPAVSIVVTCALAGLSLLAAVGLPARLPVSDVPLPVPSGVATVLSIAGALSTTALAGWEIARLRARGMRLRSGPWR